MALGLTQPLTEMSTRSISWGVGGKDGRCVRLTLPPSCAVVMKSGNLNFLEPSGPLQACNGTALPLPSIFYTYRHCTTQPQVSIKNYTIFSYAVISTHYNCICGLVLTALKMATSVAETHQWSLCSKIIHIKPSAFVDPFNKFYASNQCTEHGTYQTQIIIRIFTDEVKSSWTLTKLLINTVTRWHFSFLLYNVLLSIPPPCRTG